MTLETESVLDRRRLRRRLSLWRLVAVLALAGSVGAALSFSRAGSGAFGERKQIARVTIEGVITEDRRQLEMLRSIARAKHVSALLVFINSPGGTTTGGEALFEALRDVAARKPVVAQFGTVAASAAYIAGLATDQIVARGNTITGSVGVIFQWAEVSELMAKLGVKMNEVKSGPLKANPSPFQPSDEAGREVARQMIADSQRWFLGLVASRRGIDTAKVPGLEQGRIYSGRDAKAHNLVDIIGGEAEARRWLEESRGTPKGLRIVDWKPKREPAFGLLGELAIGLARAFGGGLGDMVARAIDPQRIEALQLDGLLAVWHPSDK